MSTVDAYRSVYNAELVRIVDVLTDSFQGKREKGYWMGELAEKAIRLMGLGAKKSSLEDAENNQTVTPLPHSKAGDSSHQPAASLNGEVVEGTQSLPCSDRQSGRCETCRAAGYWEGHGPDQWCFYEAVFLGRSAPVLLAKDRQDSCPLINHKSLPREPKA